MGIKAKLRNISRTRRDRLKYSPIADLASWFGLIFDFVKKQKKSPFTCAPSIDSIKNKF